MKAMRLEAFAPIEEMPLRLADVPKPEPGPGEILIKGAMYDISSGVVSLLEA